MPITSTYSSIFAKISESRKRKYSFAEGSISGRMVVDEFRILTSSPSLIELPPHPGRRTLSPVLTVVGTTFPSLSGAPGPTAITVASGKGLVVDDWGRKIPEAVFWCEPGVVSTFYTCRRGLPHRARPEPLNQDAVEEWYDGLDGFESYLRSLQVASQGN